MATGPMDSIAGNDADERAIRPRSRNSITPVLREQACRLDDADEVAGLDLCALAHDDGSAGQNWPPKVDARRCEFEFAARF